MNTKNKRIIVVDDDPKITRQIRLNLEIGGEYEVREENLATRALTAAREFSPDLMILDVMMPGVDGGELASQLRAIPKFRGMPIVFLTALVTPEDAKKNGGYIGGDRFLAKPVDPGELIACLKEQLEQCATPPVRPNATEDPMPHISY